MMICNQTRFTEPFKENQVYSYSDTPTFDGSDLLFTHTPSAMCPLLQTEASLINAVTTKSSVLSSVLPQK